MTQHGLHLYTGTGKGKTTAAMGLALRALGHGQWVLVLQWMKDSRSGELFALRAFERCTVMTEPMVGFLWEMDAQQRQAQVNRQNDFARRMVPYVRNFQPDLVVLDELAMAVCAGLVTEENAAELIDTALENAETVVTGYDAPDWLLSRADYLTRMTAERHPFEQGQAARKGVEW